MAVVSGRLQICSYTDKDGVSRRIAEIVADNVYFGDSKQAASDVSIPPAQNFDVLNDSFSELPFLMW